YRCRRQTRSLCITACSLFTRTRPSWIDTLSLHDALPIFFRTNDQEVRLVTIDAKTALQEKKINNAGDVLGRAKKRAADASLAGGATSVAGVDVPVDGNSASDLAYWANEADEADQYLLLGIGGSGNLLETVRKYENLLERPGVGIRLELGSRESVDAGEL